SGVTNQLVGWVNELSPLLTNEAWMEYDSVVASGEQVTSGLLALALQSMGIPARSWLGWQIPFKTSDAHGKSRIEDIGGPEFRESLKTHVAVVAGFQGIADDGRITTLGRGGSDTSAVAIAAALDAERCDIFTDVDG